MFIFVILLMLLGLLFCMVQMCKLSIKMLLGYSFLMGFILIIFYPLLITISWKSVQTLVHDRAFVTGCCIYQILESVLFIMLSFPEVNHHNKNSKAWYYHLLYYLPSMIAVVGLLGMELLFLYIFQNKSYVLLISLMGISVVMLLTVSALLLRYILTSWETIMKIKTMLLIFQIIIAMFIPLMLSNTHVISTNLMINYHHSIICAVIILLSAGTGYLLYAFNIRLHTKIITFIKTIFFRRIR
jgi:hypothetical protein